MNEPVIAKNLNDALLLGAEDQLPYEDEEEEIKMLQKRRYKQLEAEREAELRRLQGELEDEKEEEVSEDPYADMKSIDSNLRVSNLDLNAKKLIHTKLKESKINTVATMDQAEKTLEEKLPPQKGKK